MSKLEEKKRTKELYEEPNLVETPVVLSEVQETSPEIQGSILKTGVVYEGVVGDYTARGHPMVYYNGQWIVIIDPTKTASFSADYVPDPLPEIGETISFEIIESDKEGTIYGKIIY